MSTHASTLHHVYSSVSTLRHGGPGSVIAVLGAGVNLELKVPRDQI